MTSNGQPLATCWPTADLPGQLRTDHQKKYIFGQLSWCDQFIYHARDKPQIVDNGFYGTSLASSTVPKRAAQLGRWGMIVARASQQARVRP